MKKQNKIFTKEDRSLLHGILSGRAVGCDGVAVQRFLTKIMQKLPKDYQLSVVQINQKVFWKTNDAFVWQAAYEVAEEERPGLFEQLSQSKPLSSMLSSPAENKPILSEQEKQEREQAKLLAKPRTFSGLAIS